MQAVKPTLTIELNCSCPHCDCYINLMDSDDTGGVEHNDCGGILQDVTPIDGRHWSEAHESFEIDEVTCTECKNTFSVKGVEW
jgi:hypothetical protein